MPYIPTKYYYDGQDAKRIRSLTRQAVMDTLSTALQGEGLTIGSGNGEIELLKSPNAAAKRYKEGGSFVYFVQRPAKVTDQQVVGHDDGLAHSALRYDWTFLIQVSKGNVGNKVTDEQTATADNDLMDIVSNAFIENYAYFRDTLLFKQMKISPGEDRDTGNVLNPLTLTFYNLTRLATDRFITA